MGTLTVTIPDPKLQDVIDAVAATYGAEASQAGLEGHLKKHIKDTLNDYKRGRAADAVAEDSLE